jgi:hypothetical protein
MKVSLWHQFSSNNSTASYTIIGVFETLSDAQQAQQRLRQLFREIGDLQAHDRDNTYDARVNHIIQTYDTTYGKILNWEYLCAHLPRHYHQFPGWESSVFGATIVFDSNGMTTTSVGPQLRDLIEMLGAKTYAQINGKGVRIERLRLVCHSPDQDTAQRIYDALNHHLQYKGRRWFVLLPPPWAIYHPMFEVLLPDLTREQYEHVLPAWEVWYATAPDPLFENIAFFRLQLRRFLEETPFLSRVYDTLWKDTTFKEAKLSRDGQRIIIEKPNLGSELIHLLPALHKWMEHKGCEVQYEFLEEVQS